MKNFYYVMIVGIGTVVGGVLNYLYHPLMLRFLSIDQFAEFESLVSVFNVLGVLTTGLSLFLVKEISQNFNNLGRVKSIFLFSNNMLLMLGIILYVLFLLFIPLIASFLHFHDYLPLVLIGMTIIFSFQGTVLNATIQGLKKFNFISISGVIFSFIKLILGFMFVYVGFELYGAIFGFIMTSILILLISYIYVFRILKGHDAHIDHDQLKNDFKKEFLHIFHFFIVVLLISISMNMDIIFAKNLFPNDIAGTYAGISVFAKFLIFLGGAIETVYYPQIMEHKNESVPTHFIRNSFLMIFLLGFISWIFVYMFGGFFLDLMKPGFSQHIYMFLDLLIYCWFFVYISFYSKILIGWKDHKVNYLLFFGLIFLIIAIYAYGGYSIQKFIYCFIVYGLFMCIGLVYLIYKNIKSINHDKSFT